MAHQGSKLAAHGYMTVELIIAIIVGAVLILCLNNIVISQEYLAQRSRDMAVANAFAENKIEGLRSQGYLGLSIGTTNITSELPAELKSPRTGTQVISSHATGIKKIHITITYNEQGVSRTYTYASLIGELGVGQ